MSDFDDLMQGGAKSFPFETIGDAVTGFVVDVKKRQQTNMDTGAPEFWPNGEPKYMYTVSLQTELREDEADDGIRNVNLRWKSLQAVQAAVRAAGRKNIEVNGKLQLVYSGDGVKTQKGWNAPKLWTARYAPPVESDGFMTGAPEPQDGLAQARNVDHQGNPQSQQAPDWAQPQVGARSLEQFRGQPTVDRSQAGF